MKKVLEVAFRDVNEEKIEFKITYQDFNRLPRGEFRDDEVHALSSYGPAFYNFKEEGPWLFVLGRNDGNDERWVRTSREHKGAIENIVSKLNTKYRGW